MQEEPRDDISPLPEGQVGSSPKRTDRIGSPTHILPKLDHRNSFQNVDEKVEVSHRLPTLNEILNLSKLPPSNHGKPTEAPRPASSDGRKKGKSISKGFQKHLQGSSEFPELKKSHNDDDKHLGPRGFAFQVYNVESGVWGTSNKVV